LEDNIPKELADQSRDLKEDPTKNQELSLEPEKEPRASEPGLKAPKKGNAIKVIVSIFLLLVFVAWTAWYVSTHQREFIEALELFEPKTLALLCLMVFVTYLANGEILRWAMKLHGIKVPLLENLALTFCTAAANYFFPFKGAAGIRALYLKSRHGLNFTDFFSQIVLVGFITVMVSSLAALISLAHLDAKGANLALTLYFSAAFILSFALIFLGRLKLPLKILQNLSHSWIGVFNGPIIIRIVLLDVLYFFSWAGANWVALKAFGLSLGFFEAIFYAAGQIHSLLINLTPAGLGLMEAFSVFAGSLMGLTPAEALVAQGLFRVAAFGTLVLFGLLGWLYLSFQDGK
jgi:uncharacterized membrane protein YbhN (UPF0104 family)